MSDLGGARIGLLSSWLSRRNGGVFEAVVAQAELVEQLGGVPVLLALRSPDDPQDEERLAAWEVHRAPVVGPAKVGLSPRLLSMLDAARLDLLHLHGLWHYPSHAARRWTRGCGKPLVVSPHGMLADWILQSSPARKRAWRSLVEDDLFDTAARMHALTNAEATEIAKATGCPATLDRIATIPNPAPNAPSPRETMPGPHLLYLGRIHPKKNLAGLIAGWDAALDTLPPGARLTIAGWGEGGQIAGLQKTIAASRSPSSISFLGPCFGKAKEALMADSRYLVLPSHSEGLPMAILEAWAAGTPSLMSQHCNLSSGFARGAALDCGTTTETIAGSIAAAFQIDQTRWLAMSIQAQRLATEDFGSQRVAQSWRDVYASLL